MCDNLLDYYNGVLNDSEKTAFEAHLKECSACQEEWAEWQELTADLPYLSEEEEPLPGMKKRILTNVYGSDSELDDESKMSHQAVQTKQINEPVIPVTQQYPKRRSGWMSGALAAGLLLSLGTNVYLYAENDKNEQVIQEQMSKTFKSVQLASEQTDSIGTVSMVQEAEKMNLVIQTQNMTQVKGNEAYQVWLIEGDKKYRAGTFLPDESGNGAVVFNVNFPGEHKWDAVAISHEPTPNSKQPKGKIVMASNL
jgi:anti-sigma-K factor RskA